MKTKQDIALMIQQLETGYDKIKDSDSYSYATGIIIRNACKAAQVDILRWVLDNK